MRHQHTIKATEADEKSKRGAGRQERGSQTRSEIMEITCTVPTEEEKEPARET